MYTTTTRAVLAAAAAIPLCLAVAAPASAAPGDVTYSATTVGNTITSTFTNNSDQPIGCEYGGFYEPFNPDNPPVESDYAFADGIGPILPGESGSKIASDLPIAEELFMEWACFTQGFDGNPDEVWGTRLTESIDEINGGPYDPTFRATRVIVGVSVVPGAPIGICSGSACLPTGSFGF